MSQYYGPSQRPATPKSDRSRWIVMGGAALAVVLIAAGVIVILAGGDKKEPAKPPVAGGSLTPAPGATNPAPPSSTTAPVITKGPYDQGVEIGGGVWFTPAKGWIKDAQTASGHNYVLPDPARPGAIDGWFWIRQTKQLGAKAFAEHVADVESNNLQHVVISNGGYRTCLNKALKLCYAMNYSAVVPIKGKKPAVFSGFIQAFEDRNGQTTATDSALQTEVWARRKQEILGMNGTLVRSF
jgi:hypothetical protein